MTSLKQLGALLLAFSTNGIAATWETRTDTDAMTDRKRVSAVVRNDSGHTFSVYRVNPDGGPVWANFAISDQVFDQIDHEKLIVYRVDKNKPDEVASSRRVEKLLGQKMVEWEPKWVNFQLWHGKGDQPMGSIMDLMTGTELVVRYYLSTGGYKDTQFSLKGAKAAISSAIGLDPNLSPEELGKRSAEERAKADVLIEFTNATVEHIKACAELPKSERAACKEKHDTCHEKYKAANDAKSFRACVGP